MFGSRPTPPKARDLPRRYAGANDRSTFRFPEAASLLSATFGRLARLAEGSSRVEDCPSELCVFRRRVSDLHHWRESKTSRSMNAAPPSGACQFDLVHT